MGVSDIFTGLGDSNPKGRPDSLRARAAHARASLPGLIDDMDDFSCVIRLTLL